MAVVVAAALAPVGCGGGHPVTRAGVRVPAVAGRAVGTASARLRALGLHVALAPGYSRRASGTVTGSSPTAGARVVAGSTVTLAVSRGPAPPAGKETPSGVAPSASTPSSACRGSQYTRADGSCAQVPAATAGAAPANSPEGRRQRAASPDCAGAPPPPRGYSGPVQC